MHRHYVCIMVDAAAELSSAIIHNNDRVRGIRLAFSGRWTVPVAHELRGNRLHVVRTALYFFGRRAIFSLCREISVENCRRRTQLYYMGGGGEIDLNIPSNTLITPPPLPQYFFLCTFIDLTHKTIYNGLQSLLYVLIHVTKIIACTLKAG